MDKRIYTAPKINVFELIVQNCMMQNSVTASPTKETQDNFGKATDFWDDEEDDGSQNTNNSSSAW